MNICKADAIAQLAKWYNGGTRVRRCIEVSRKYLDRWEND